MSVLIPERDLPQDLTVERAVEVAYSTELASIQEDLVRGLPVLVECEKDLAPHLFLQLRQRMRGAGWKCLYLDGRPRSDAEAAAALGAIPAMLAQLREAVRGPIERKVVVLPHLDLLAATQGGLTPELREVIPLLYENPEVVWLGFRDPSFAMPSVVENLFPRRYGLLGVARPRLRHLITQAESRKLGTAFNSWALYKHVSGMNAVRLRRLLSTLDGEDYPASPAKAYKRIRQATLQGFLEVPDVDLDGDLGGYPRVKQRLRTEILEILAQRDALSSERDIERVESLIPRGMIFWGPPGTGKTLFAKAMATAIGAAITIVSGPELKSRWVGESEQNLRQIFHRARQSAPSIIVFDELDSFASARGSYTGSGVEHSMVNQLLTEMDGFHREELVFVVGTTNFVESLDPALLRPGRFEFHLHIPYPDESDRREILRIFDRRMQLQMTDDALESAVQRTSAFVQGSALGTLFSGDHLHALCRALARRRIRENRSDATTIAHIETALREGSEPRERSEHESFTFAVHEAGHALCAAQCPHAEPAQRLSLQPESSFSAALLSRVVQQTRSATRGQLLDELCVLLAGREAELLFFDDLSAASAVDTRQAANLARLLVEEFGLGGSLLAAPPRSSENAIRECSSALLEQIEQRIGELLENARTRAAALVREHQPLLRQLAEQLRSEKSLDAAAIQALIPTAGS